MKAISEAQEVLGFIPARGGSKGILNKNIRKLAGKPLVEYSIEAAKNSDISRVVVSTESKEIADVAIRSGAEVPFLRPSELAQSDSVLEDVLVYSLRELFDAERYRPDVIVLLQPTSPLRTSEHINSALRLLRCANADSVVSVSEPMEHPAEMVRWNSSRHMEFVYKREAPPGLEQRQSYPEVYFLNGAIYCFTVECLEQYKDRYGNNTVPLIMPQTLSIDIDTEDEFRLAELVMQSQDRAVFAPTSSRINPSPFDSQ
jgi:CMP-N,N'-diacetyllegionaminic acid synthase